MTSHLFTNDEYHYTIHIIYMMIYLQEHIYMMQNIKRTYTHTVVTWH